MATRTVVARLSLPLPLPSSFSLALSPLRCCTQLTPRRSYATVVHEQNYNLYHLPKSSPSPSSPSLSSAPGVAAAAASVRGTRLRLACSTSTATASTATATAAATATPVTAPASRKQSSRQRHAPPRGNSSSSNNYLLVAGAAAIAAVACLYSTEPTQRTEAPPPPPPEGEGVDSGTGVPPFPRTLAVDTSRYALLGLGIRTVSFLRIQVYVVGFYVHEDDLPALRAAIRARHDAATPMTTARPEHEPVEEALRRRLLDPVEGEELWDALLGGAVQFRSAFRIVPTRNTGLFLLSPRPPPL